MDSLVNDDSISDDRPTRPRRRPRLKPHDIPHSNSQVNSFKSLPNIMSLSPLFKVPNISLFGGG